MEKKNQNKTKIDRSIETRRFIEIFNKFQRQKKKKRSITSSFGTKTKTKTSSSMREKKNAS